MTQPVATFENRLPTSTAAGGVEGGADQAHAHEHAHDHGDGHTHDHGDGAGAGAGPDEHGHTHEHLEHAGKPSPTHYSIKRASIWRTWCCAGGDDELMS